MNIFIRLRNWLLGPIEYQDPYSAKVTMGPEEMDGEVWTIVLYVRDAWYKKWPRLTRHDASLFHIRRKISETRDEILPIEASRIIDKNGRRIKKPTFRQIVDMW